MFNCQVDVEVELRKGEGQTRLLHQNGETFPMLTRLTQVQLLLSLLIDHLI